MSNAHAYQPMDTHRLSAEIARRSDDEQRAWHPVFQFLDDFRGADPDARATLIAHRPASTGDERWDAFVAALAEHLAFHDGIPVPAWTQAPELFLDRFWFTLAHIDPVRRAETVAKSPAAFRRHGVLIERHDLDRA